MDILIPSGGARSGGWWSTQAESRGGDEAKKLSDTGLIGHMRHSVCTSWVYRKLTVNFHKRSGNS
jgi:hypothetical protein